MERVGGCWNSRSYPAYVMVALLSSMGYFPTKMRFQQAQRLLASIIDLPTQSPAYTTRHNHGILNTTHHHPPKPDLHAPPPSRPLLHIRPPNQHVRNPCSTSQLHSLRLRRMVWERIRDWISHFEIPRICGESEWKEVEERRYLVHDEVEDECRV